MSRSIFLIGFMGAGKTTFGKKLATKLSLQFIDLDEAVCTANGYTSVTNLIESKGFNFFRETESETLRGLDLDDKIISTGGGTPCFFDTMQWMLQHGKVVYLQVDSKSLFNRLKQSDRNERPLLRGLDDKSLQGFIDDKLSERLPYYEQAHIKFNPLKQKLEELLVSLSSTN